MYVCAMYLLQLHFADLEGYHLEIVGLLVSCRTRLCYYYGG